MVCCGTRRKRRRIPWGARIAESEDHAPVIQRLGWLATLGIVSIVSVGACIPTGARVPTTVPAASSGASASAVVAPSPSPSGPSARPSFIYPTPTPLPTFFVYQVRPGDTLTSIAQAHGTTARSISFWNRGRYPSLDPDSSTYRPNRIDVGWELVLIPDVELDPEDLPEPSPPASPSPASSTSLSPAPSG
jgi:LysM domain